MGCSSSRTGVASASRPKEAPSSPATTPTVVPANATPSPAQRMSRKHSHDVMPINMEASLDEVEVETKYPNLGPDELFPAIDATVAPVPATVTAEDAVRGWKTIRIFVSSTFADMHFERETLVKEVFPEIRVYCEQRQLRVVECDLRWGVPAETSGADTINICLSEIDRCRAENQHPFFINMLAERFGWTPQVGDVPRALRQRYGWIQGASVTLMEIVHAAYRDGNPNAFFLLRTPGLLDGVDVDDNCRRAFVDTGEAAQKLSNTKSAIIGRFPTQHMTYGATCEGEYDREGKLIVKLDETFAAATKAFLKETIARQYPIGDTPPDAAMVERGAQDVFVESRGEVVLGRDEILSQIEEHISRSTSPQTPLMVIGDPGAGKSAVLASVARSMVNCLDKNQATIFYHFVGATPGSTDLVRFVRRLYLELDFKDVPSDVNELVNGAPNVIKQATTSKQVIIIVDAINQFAEDDKPHVLNWVPEVCPPNATIIISTIHRTESHLMLAKREPNPIQIPLKALDEESKRAIVRSFMATYNKTLDNFQLDTLISKSGSSNPLWLTTAAEELRVFGIFEKLTEKIHTFPDDLIDMLMSVIERLVREVGFLVEATVCLLECSRHGLLEGEVLQLLCHEEELKFVKVEEVSVDNKAEEQRSSGGGVEANTNDTLKQAVHDEKLKAYREDEEGSRKDKDSEADDETKKRLRKEKDRLPYVKWLPVYHGLRRFTRPCGEAGGGRLDFYHRTVSKAVRRHYFQESEDGEEYKMWWHGKLASFFEEQGDALRRGEELPYHLELLLDNTRLTATLLEWDMLSFLMSSVDRKHDLMRHWRSIGGYGVASAGYKRVMEVWRSDRSLTDKQLLERQLTVARFLADIGQFDDSYDMYIALETLVKKVYGDNSLEMADVYLGQADALEQKRGAGFGSHNEHALAATAAEKSVTVRRNCGQTVDQGLVADALFIVAMNLAPIVRRGDAGDWTQERAYVTCKAAAEECFAIREAISDPKLGEAAITAGSPAWSQSHYEEALKWFDRAVAICEKTLGEDHASTARALSNKGVCLRVMNDLEGSYACHARAYKIRATVLGEEHPRTQRSKREMEYSS